MQYYSAKLRLAGSPMNEVRGVFSAPEILIMQYIHGVDAITEVKKHEMKDENLGEHKQMLKSKYDQAMTKRDQSVDKIFGALGRIPTKLPEDLLERFDIIDEDDIISVAKSVTKLDKNVQHHYHPKTQTEVDRLERTVPQEEVNLYEILE